MGLLYTRNDHISYSLISKSNILGNGFFQAHFNYSLQEAVEWS